MRPAVIALLLAVAAAVGCSKSPNPTPSGGPGVCGEGYLPAVNGACPKGTCLQAEASASCCGSQCAACSDKGLIDADDGGACPAGTCVSADLTEALTCCETCPSDGDAAAEASSDAASDAALESGPGDAAANE